MSLPIRFFGNTASSDILLFVGGSGDSKDSYTNLISRLEPIFPLHKIITFSFKGVEDNSDLPLVQQVGDLMEICDEIINKSDTSISLIATSNGAFSASHIIIDNRYGAYFKDIVLLDPADHYVDTQETGRSSKTWTGLQKYLPTKATSSSLMKKIASEIKVHVVNFTIRNYGVDGYVADKERGIDNVKMVSRLNNDMVKSFYEQTPLINRGFYIEDNSLPHAFMRDGDVDENIDRIINILRKCILK